MKKLISILMITVILVSLMIMPAYAESFSEMYPEELYMSRFEEKYMYWTFYHELYYHHVDEENPDSPIDWALVHCVRDMSEDPSGDGGRAVTTYALVDQIIIHLGYYYAPFETAYAIYDVEKDEFTDLFDVNIDDYEGLREYLPVSKIGRPIGDVDPDGELTIMDATEIQRLIAKLSDYQDEIPWRWSWLSGKSIKYMSDFDRDGKRTIMDATAIQLKLAKK